MKASRRSAAMRKMKILSPTGVGCKVMPLFFSFVTYFFGMHG
jgi:hypothetical protein